MEDDRSSWGPRYEGVGGERIVERSDDGDELPLYSPIPLLLTYTSSGKMMAKESFSTAKKGDWKRKAQDESVKEVPMPKKKARLWSEESEVKAKIERQKNSGTPKANGEDEASRYFNDLLASVAESKQQATELENQLAEERTHFAKHYDDLHSQWLTYTRQKVKQFDSIKTHHTAEIHDHNTRNGNLVKRISDLRSRLSDAKDRLNDRGKLLEKVKKRWRDEQGFFKGKIEDLNALDHENVAHFGDVNLRKKRTETDAWDDMDEEDDTGAENGTGADDSTVAAKRTEAAKHARVDKDSVVDRPTKTDNGTRINNKDTRIHECTGNDNNTSDIAQIQQGASYKKESVIGLDKEAEPRKESVAGTHQNTNGNTTAAIPPIKTENLDKPKAEVHVKLERQEESITDMRYFDQGAIHPGDDQKENCHPIYTQIRKRIFIARWYGPGQASE
ncbi:MAG: hypothetical protein Q9164_007569 [Protoblastenia rupestris]